MEREETLEETFGGETVGFFTGSGTVLGDLEMSGSFEISGVFRTSGDLVLAGADGSSCLFSAGVNFTKLRFAF